MSSRHTPWRVPTKAPWRVPTKAPWRVPTKAPWRVPTKAPWRVPRIKCKRNHGLYTVTKRTYSSLHVIHHAFTFFLHVMNHVFTSVTGGKAYPRAGVLGIIVVVGAVDVFYYVEVFVVQVIPVPVFK
jgi:hypothetical protein